MLLAVICLDYITRRARCQERRALSKQEKAIFLFFCKKGVAKYFCLWYNTRVAQGYSSAGRVLVSKTKGRGFESFCPCQTQRTRHSARSFLCLAGAEVRREPLARQEGGKAAKRILAQVADLAHESLLPQDRHSARSHKDVCIL